MLLLKSKYWIGLIGALLVACVGLSLWLYQPGKTATQASIKSDGKVIAVVDLRIDRELTVTDSKGGINVVTVKAGKIAVTAATCPDHHCVKRGFCDGGTAIVCLPNRLVIEFLTEQEIDGAVG